MNKIRVQTLLLMYRRKDILKAVALSVFIKKHVESSLVKDWSINKIRQITGLSATTIKKRLQTLREIGLTEIVGGKHLLFHRIKSSCDRKNIDISRISDTRVKDIEQSLWALLVVLIQRQKDYVRLQLNCAANGRNLVILKEARRKRKMYGWRSRFVENGLSYKGIAQKLGISLKKAFEIVRYGVKMGFFAKITHFRRYFIKGIRNIAEVLHGFTFISRKADFIYKVDANTYVLSPEFRINTIGNN